MLVVSNCLESDMTTINLLSAAWILLAAPGGAGSVGEPMVYKTAEGKSLSLYVVKPADWKSSDRRPAIVFFHGGGWTGGQPTQFNEHCGHFAARGMVCIQVQYRLIGRGAKETPLACVYDARSAMRWVRGRADQLGIDPKRIASAGGSAGGHLAAHVGMVDALDDPADDKSVSPKSNAMLLFNPVFDNGPDGWGHGRVGDRYKEFSPAHNVSRDDPPAIVFLGSEDKLIPVKTLDAFKTAMEKAGVRCEARVTQGAGHGFFNPNRDGGVHFKKTLAETDEFLVSLGWLKAKS